MEIIYRYDGSFEGFLCCVFESYVNKEIPAGFQSAANLQPTFFDVRWIETDPAHAQRILRSIQKRSPYAEELVAKGFLTCADNKEQMLYRFIRALYDIGPTLMRRLSDDALHPLLKAVRHLDGEVHLLRGFVRFSDLNGVLVGEIQPKNRVLPLLRQHFCDRFYNESLILYDRTNKEALFYRDGKWCITPLEHFEIAHPDAQEAQFRRLWKRFYDTVSIAERYNPKTRRTHMPMRYWNTMTEFQGEDYFRPVAEMPLTPARQTLSAAAPAPGVPAAKPAPEILPGSAQSAPGSVL